MRAAKVIYLEGYMWDRPAAKSAFQKAGAIAREAGRRVALTLSDLFCVDRFRGEFIELMRSKTVDTIFANTDEILSLYETPHFDEALDALARRGSARHRHPLGKRLRRRRRRADLGGARLPDRQARRHHRRRRHVRRRLPRRPRARRDMTTCGRLGALAAAEIIQHLGARPNVSLKTLANEKGIRI